MKDVTQFFKIGPILLKSVRTGLLLHDREHGNEMRNTTQNLKRLMSVLAPLRDINPTITLFSYGNSLLINFAFFFPNSTRLFYSDTNKTIFSSPYNEFFEPTNSTLVMTNYQPTNTLDNVKPFPEYVWSPVFTSFLTKCTTIGVATRFEFNTTKDGIWVEEGIGVFYDLQYLNQLLNRVIFQNTDMETKSVNIVIVQRNGLVVADSSEDLTKCNLKRKYLSSISNHFKSVAESLLNLKMLSNINFTLPIDRTKKKVVLNINGIRVSSESYDDHEHNLDLIVIVSTTEYGFIKVLLTSSPIVLSISIVLIVLGTLCMCIFSQLTTRAILKVATNMFNISNMQISKVNYSKFLNIIFELKLLQNSCRAVQRVQVGFAKYTPKEIIREIVVSKEGTIFSMKHMETTVMFTDIADFTNLSESMSISSLIELLSHYFTAVTMCVERNGGIIDKFIGDGTMSIFSHPLRILEQHSLQACQSALECLLEIEKLNEMQLTSLGIRIGINTGLAAIGNIGSIDRLNYTAIGDSVNAASRLESLCKRYNLQVLIGEATYEQVKQEYCCFFVDTVKLKGKDIPMDIYLIETKWTTSNALQKEVHDELIEVRDYLYSHQFQLLIDKVNSVKECCTTTVQTTNTTTVTSSETAIATTAEPATTELIGNDIGDTNSAPSLIHSNMYFLELLEERAKILIEREKFDNNIDRSLILTEK